MARRELKPGLDRDQINVLGRKDFKRVGVSLPVDLRDVTGLEPGEEAVFNDLKEQAEQNLGVIGIDTRKGRK